MASPFVGEIRLFAGNFAPSGWMFCNGQLLPISENDVLFQLIGTTYGGDGETTFALPDLRSRIPIHQGGGFLLAENGGVESVTLTVNQLPAHTHPFIGSTNQAGNTNPPGNVVGQIPGGNVYVEEDATSPLGAQSLAPAGASQPHDNMQPYLCISFILSLFGIFPSQS
jgi:microcystin-dependent protein